MDSLTRKSTNVPMYYRWNRKMGASVSRIEAGAAGSSVQGQSWDRETLLQ